MFIGIGSVKNKVYNEFIYKKIQIIFYKLNILFFNCLIYD